MKLDQAVKQRSKEDGNVWQRKNQYNPEKDRFCPGDTITGSVILSLKKPVNARELAISLIGEQKVTRTQGMTGGQPGASTTTQRTRLYDFKQQLDTEKEYNKGGEYPFEIKIPANILSTGAQMPELGGMLGQGLRLPNQLRP